MTDTVRVYELARRLGITSEAVLAALADVGVYVTSPSSTIPSEAATQVTLSVATRGTTPASEPARPDVAALVRAAYEAARSTGRLDWRTMTVAVLKNRLLDLTDRAFREQDYGARSIMDIALSLPELLQVDRAASPPLVTLLDDAGTPLTAVLPVLGPSVRVRSDLWHAVLDTPSAGRWIFDQDRAVRLEELAAGDGGRVLPTAKADELLSWRSAFAERMSGGLIGDDLERVLWWSKHRAPSATLPSAVRREWNAELKSNVVEALTGWFKARQLDLPDDLLVRDADPPAARPRGQEEDSPLRRFVLACVREMTPSELAMLPIPAAAAARATGSRDAFAPGRVS